MTPEEQMKLNARIQQEAANREFEQNARLRALEIAASLIPRIGYPVTNDPPMAPDQLLKCADEIYNWLIKNNQ